MEKKTPTRTALEKLTPEEVVEKFGFSYYFVSFVKSLKRHDSDRHRRKRERAEKAEKKKQARTIFRD